MLRFGVGVLLVKCVVVSLFWNSPLGSFVDSDGNQYVLLRRIVVPIKFINTIFFNPTTGLSISQYYVATNDT